MDNAVVSALLVQNWLVWSFSSSCWQDLQLPSAWRLWHTTGGGSVWSQKELIKLMGQRDPERAAWNSVSSCPQTKASAKPSPGSSEAEWWDSWGCHIHPVYYSQSSTGPQLCIAWGYISCTFWPCEDF